MNKKPLTGSIQAALQESMRTPQDTMTDMIDWLMSHEEDIANEVGDFGDLKQVFEELTGKKPNGK